MKRIAYILIFVFLMGLFFTTTYLQVKARPDFKSPDEPVIYMNEGSHFSVNTLEFNTFNRLFLFNQAEVCRKPVSLNIDFKGLKNYQFKSFLTHKSTNLGGEWIKIEGDNVYKNGNSTLLIPRSYIAPTRAIFHIEEPRIILRKVD